jgi:hypothetical protein
MTRKVPKPLFFSSPLSSTVSTTSSSPLFFVYNDVFCNVRILRWLDSPPSEGNLEDVKVIPQRYVIALLAPLAERLLTMTLFITFSFVAQYNEASFLFWLRLRSGCLQWQMQRGITGKQWGKPPLLEATMVEIPETPTNKGACPIVSQTDTEGITGKQWGKPHCW